jgi:hypothetical protein
MKEKCSLKLFCLFLLLIYVSTLKVEAPKEIFQHYYFLQKLYPGTDPIKALNVKQKINLYFFTLNKKLLFYKRTALDKNIQGTTV